MSDNKLTRQQIYDRIRETSKDEFVLEEMKRLGFWDKNRKDNAVPELIIKKETELQKELTQLLKEKQKYQNKEAVLKEMRLKRMAEAKLKQEETKKKREQKHFEKAEAWKKKKETEIIYLGEDVSIGLNNNNQEAGSLPNNGLPQFENEAALANAMGISLSELRFLSFNRKVAVVNHYHKFYLPKKSGGKRLISAPMPRLKNLQYWILENILNKINLHPAAQGFVTNRSIVSNAQPHVGKNLVVNVDVKDFFPSIHFKRVKAMLQQLGYTEKIAIILALLCTEAVTEEVTLDGKQYFVQKGLRVLPLGAPTSPAITNILCFQLDKRLQGLASKTNCQYTRYADDITFSSNSIEVKPEQLVWRIKKILEDEHFSVHPKKICIMRKGSKQEVIGVVVNEKMNINRKKLRQFRALLHQLKKGEITNIRWGKSNNIHSVLGYVQFIKMVNPAKAAQLQQQYGTILSSLMPPSANLSRETQKTEVKVPPTSGNKKLDDDKPWWNVV